MRNNLTYRPLLILLAALLPFGCTSDEQTPAGDPQPAMTLSVTEQPWEEETTLLTRSGETETETDLKESSQGFGLFCSELSLDNQPVTWGSAANLWSVERTVLWRNSTPTANVYAYAPYEGSITLDGNKSRAFTCTADNTTDLLWASHEDLARSTGTATLAFRHALSKLSFGTITNRYGRDLTLTDIKLTGFHASGRLSLADGTWSEQTGTQPITRTPTSPGLPVADGATVSFGAADILQIPTTASITFTFTTTDFKEETATFSIPMEQGVHKLLNLTVTNNFEVVIDN